MKKEMKCTKNRETKNQIIYGAGDEIKALYLSKNLFEGDVPNEIKVTLEW